MSEEAAVSGEEKEGAEAQEVSVSATLMLLGEHDKMMIHTLLAVKRIVEAKETAKLKELMDHTWAQIKPHVETKLNDDALVDRIEKAIPDEAFWKTVLFSLNILGQVLQQVAENCQDEDLGEGLED